MKLSKSRQHLHNFLEKHEIISLVEELFEYTPGLLFFVKDSQRRFVYVNQGLSEMFGLNRKADIIGKFDTEYCDEYVESMFKQDDETILKQGITIKNKIELVTTLNGVIKWHITTKAPLWTRDGRVGGLAGVTREFESDQTTQLQHPALGKVIDYINHNYSRALTSAELASVAGISVSALGRNFKRSFHLTPGQYINRYRVSQASKRLSNSDTPIASIASECGFFDQSHFSKTFQSILHASPGAYRKRYR
jgi:AraC-like DNA-binding protein